MKTAFFQTLLLVVAFATSSCKEEKVEAPKQVDSLRFDPVEGETWTYKVEVTLDPSARDSEGQVEAGPEGEASSYEKVRRYLGLKPLSNDNPELAMCFEVSKGGKVRELEFTQLTEEGIVSLAWQEAGKDRLIMDQGIVLIPADKVPGSLWSRSIPNPNDPDGPPMFARQFQYFGFEEIQVLGEKREAHRVKVVGITGQIELQRDFWFVNQLGIVKERKSYYSQKKRLALTEETLVGHTKP